MGRTRYSLAADSDWYIDFLYDLNVFNILRDAERVFLQSHLFKILGLSVALKGPRLTNFKIMIFQSLIPLESTDPY